METVVDEKPLSFATSRIVTIEPVTVELRTKLLPEDQPAHSRPLEFMPPLADTTAECETSVKQGPLISIRLSVCARSPDQSTGRPAGAASVRQTGRDAVGNGAAKR